MNQFVLYFAFHIITNYFSIAVFLAVRLSCFNRLIHLAASSALNRLNENIGKHTVMPLTIMGLLLKLQKCLEILSAAILFSSKSCMCYPQILRVDDKECAISKATP